jgi:hypothetical protein
MPTVGYNDALLMKYNQTSDIGFAQQTDRLRTRHHRKNDQISSRSHHEEDAGGVAHGLGQNGSKARNNGSAINSISLY